MTLIGELKRMKLKGSPSAYFQVFLLVGLFLVHIASLSASELSLVFLITTQLLCLNSPFSREALHTVRLKTFILTVGS